MTTLLPADKLQRLCELITFQTGIHIPRQRLVDLEGALLAITREFGFADVHLCAEWLLSEKISQKQVKILARYITIGETYFYRDSNFFSTLRIKIIPELIRLRRLNGRYLRIWSAACCTGEEAYSLAILLSEMIPDLKKWDITLIGNDINLNFLKKAQQGLYRPWSFRNTPSWFMKYFRKTEEGNYIISDTIRQMVRFSFLNLAEDSYPSSENNTNLMDMVFCRNALMYFPRDKAQQVVRRFYRSINREGWLALSACENSIPFGTSFEPVFIDKVMMFRKGPAWLAEGCEQVPAFIPPATEDTVVLPSSVDPAGQELPTAERFAYPAPADQVKTETAPQEHDHYLEAQAHYEQGRYGEAEEKLAGFAGSSAFDKSAKQRPPILLLLTRICANQGKIKEALGWCDQLVAADTLNPAGYFLRATILLENGDIERSVVSLRQALYLDPDFILANFLLGNQMRLLGKHTMARKHFNNTLALLDNIGDHEILPESEGLSAGSLRDIICTSLGSTERSGPGGRS